MDQQKRIAELERALIAAMEALEGFYGGDADDSETLRHLANVLNKKGA